MSPVQRSRASLVGLAAALVLISGCGGGGGGPVGPAERLLDIRVDAIDSSGAVVDLQNLAAGQMYTLRIRGVFDSGEVRLVTGGSAGTTAPPSVALVSGRSIQAIATNLADYGITVTYGGISKTSPFGVKANTGTVTGYVRTTNGYPVRNANLRFFNAAALQVGSITVSDEGRFRTRLPASAVRFTVDLRDSTYVVTTGVPPTPSTYGVYNQFLIGGEGYTATVAGCTASMRAPIPGGTTSLPDDVVVYGKGLSVPPPPPGCLR